MSPPPRISLIVHTRDSARTLPALLASTAWLDERIVVDMASTDGSPDMARDAGCTLVSIEPVQFSDALRNRFLSQASHPWTLVLDSDEHLADDAEGDLRDLVANLPDNVAGVWIPRFNRIAGKVLRGSGWYPDHQLRLFRTGAVRFAERHHRPPQLVDTTMSTVYLDPPNCQHIHHRNYSSLQEFVERQLHYAVTDVYDLTPSAFDFESYLARAAQEFDQRHDPDHDGDMSYALALLMYWNELTRGLIHWERLGHTPPLPQEPPPLLVPQQWETTGGDSAETTREIEALQRRVRRLRRELNEMRNSRSVRLTRPLRALSGIICSIHHRTPHVTAAEPDD